MPSYPTIDHLPDLLPAAMASATSTSFGPAPINGGGWENSAPLALNAAVTGAVFRFDAKAGASYNVSAALSYRHSHVTVYDAEGNTIAVTNEYLGDGFASWIAPYTGSYYIRAQRAFDGPQDAFSFSLLENLDSIGAAPSYRLTPVAEVISEGESAQFLLTTTNVAPGTKLSWNWPLTTLELDILGRQPGSVVVGADGKATISIPFMKDQISDGVDVIDLSLTKSGVLLATSTPVMVKDTSLNTTALSTKELYDELIGTDLGERLYAGFGAHGLEGKGGDDILTGASGIHTAHYLGARADYTVVAKGNKTFTVTDHDGSEGSDILINMPRIGFADVSLAVDEAATYVYALYRAAFDRTPDLAGMGYWLHEVDHGLRLHDVAKHLYGSPEFTALYGTNPGNRELVTQLYRNVLDREPDAAGVDYWTGILDTQAASAAQVLEGFSVSEENREAIATLVGTGVAYLPYGA